MAGPYIFSKLARAGREAGFTPAQLRRGEQDAVAWFRRKASQVRSVNANRLMQETKSRLFARGGPEDVGSMLCFWYRAKHEATLPYYDQFPLIFPMQFDGDSFLSINLHYLPPRLRAALMDQLYTLAVRNADNEVERLALSYEILARAARFSAFRPCIKRHLFAYRKSKFFYVRPDEWDAALMLPTARFVGATQETAWRHSSRAAREASA